VSEDITNLTRYTEVQNWLKGKSKGTKTVYTSALKVFTEYNKMTPVELIDEAEADSKKSGREKRGPQRKIIGFFEYLRTEYKSTRNGFKNSKIQRKKRRISKIDLLKSIFEKDKMFPKENQKKFTFLGG
jgi:hypothetical protein